MKIRFCCAICTKYSFSCWGGFCCKVNEQTMWIWTSIVFLYIYLLRGLPDTYTHTERESDQTMYWNYTKSPYHLSFIWFSRDRWAHSDFLFSFPFKFIFLNYFAWVLVFIVFQVDCVLMTRIYYMQTLFSDLFADYTRN